MAVTCREGFVKWYLKGPVAYLRAQCNTMPSATLRKHKSTKPFLQAAATPGSQLVISVGTRSASPLLAYLEIMNGRGFRVTFE